MKNGKNIVFAIFLSFISILSTFVFPINIFAQFAQTADEITGTIDVPPGVAQYQTASQAGGGDIGIIFFMSNMIKLFTVVMGLYVVFNVILAGYHFIFTTGDASAYEKARSQITQSAIGLMLIVMAYTFTGIVSLIFFGDPMFILNPVIPALP